jgi:hypothetical protein
MTRLSILLATAATRGFSAPLSAATTYLNIDNISVAVGSGTGTGTFNNTFDNGQTIDKVIDAPTATAQEFHDQTTHIWFTGSAPNQGLELIFTFGVSYDITTLHFWNYTGEGYDVDNVEFTFFNSLGASIGSTSIQPALGSSGGITAQNIALQSPLNTRSVRAYLTGSNGQIDFQNIGFTANVSDPTLDPAPQVPLPAGGLLLLAGLGAVALRRRR